MLSHISQVDDIDPDWATNSAGLNHSHKHGFGLMSAWNIVNAAKVSHDKPLIFRALQAVGRPV